MAFAQISDYFIERLHLLTRNEIVVYCYLVKAHNSGSGRCDPRQSTIAKETNLQTSRVSEAIKGLEAKGWAVADEFGMFVLPEKVTESVTSQVTNSVRKSYGKRNESYGKRNEKELEKLRNAEVGVTQCVTSFNRIENTNEKKEGEEASAAHATDFEILPMDDDDEPVFDPNPLIAIYQRYTDNEINEKRRLVITDRVQDEAIWKEAVQYWVGRNHNVDNIPGICTKYDELVAEYNQLPERPKPPPSPPKTRTLEEKQAAFDKQHYPNLKLPKLSV